MELRLPTTLLCATLLLSSASAHSRLNENSQRLAYCENVMYYAGNLFLLQNNEGAAKVIFMNAARASASLLFFNQIDGTVKGETMAEIRSWGPKVRQELDADRSRVLRIVDGCLPVIQLASEQHVRAGRRIAGKTFDTFVDEAVEAIHRRLGLR